MTDPELRELRRRLDAIPRGRGRRIPVELRARITACVVVKCRERGDGWSELVRKFGVAAGMLRRWSSRRTSEQVLLRRVEVTEAAAAERTVTLVSPTGMRVEGVTIADAISVLRGLA